MCEYTPNLVNPLYPGFESIRIIRRFRLIIELLKGGYKVYNYLRNNEIVGSCAVVPGRNALKFCTTKDIILKFLYIDPTYRGNGYGKEILKLVLNHTDVPYSFGYAWVQESNIPSWKAFESVGFEQIGNVMVTRWLRRIHILPEGEVGSRLYRIKNGAV